MLPDLADGSLLHLAGLKVLASELGRLEGQAILPLAT
jgi:hypothetical protein